MKKLFSVNYWAMKGLALLVLVMMGGGGDVMGQTLIAGWDFQTTTNGGSSCAAAPSSPKVFVSNFGTGTIYFDGTNGSSNWISTTTGNELTAFAGTAVNAGTSFSTITTGQASLALVTGTSNSANGKFAVFKFSMSNYKNLIISYATQSSTTGFQSNVWEYSTNGTTWNSIQTISSITTSFTTKTLNTISELNNVTNAYLRFNGTGGTAAAGNQRLDNIQFNAIPILYFRSKTSGNWSALGTWEMSSDNISWINATSIPDANSESINIQATHTVTLDANTTISNTTVASTGSLIVSSSKTLTIPAGKSFTLKSDANGTASIGNSAGTITGNITVERYIPSNRKYRFLAAPVVGATAANWRNNGTNTAGIGTHITGGSVANNFDQSTLNAPSAFWYNEVNAGNLTDVGSGASSDPGWTAFADGNTEALTNGKGFRIFVRGDRTLSLTGSIPTANNTTLSVTGSYPGASVSIATTKTNSNTNSGFNLVGNPYPATIDWNTVTRPNISATYATFNPTSNTYVEWNGNTGSASQYIASGQAFFVNQLTGTTSSITIAEANKVSNAAGNFFRNKLSDHLKVSMKYDSANYDAAFIHFREDAQNDFDTYDGLKFQNAGVNIASVGTDGKRYNINSLASLTETTEIPLSVLGSALTNFELKFEDVETFKNHELYLIDHYLNKMLLLSNGFTYPIELSSDSASIKDGRFKIVFVQKATGINTNEKNANAFILYPNPAANSIHLLLDAKNTNNENVSFEIYNQLGARLQQGSLDFTTAKDQTIAIDNLAQGSYFIKLQGQQHNQTIKFIK